MNKYLLHAFLMLMLFASCSPRSTTQIESTATITSSPVPTPTKHPPTPTMTPTVMILPSPTYTPEKLNNAGMPTGSQIETVFASAEIEFPESFTTKYKDPNYIFVLRLSKKIMARTGEEKFQLSPYMASKLAYETLGKILYMFNDNYPKFKDKAQDTNYDPITGLSEYQSLAREAIEKKPLSINNLYYSKFSGQADSISINIITKKEFEEYLLRAQSNNINSSCTLSSEFMIDNPNDAATYVCLTQEGQLMFVGYNNGEIHPFIVNPDRPVTSKQFIGNTKINYASSIIGDLEMVVFQSFPALFNSNGPSSFDIQSFITYICPPSETAQDLDDVCESLINEAFATSE